MSKRLDGTSMFTGVNAGFTNAFAQLSGQYADGITLENLNKALTNTNIINSSYGATFASYMTNNFNSIDKDRDGIISAEEIQNLMSQMATQGMTREQLMTLAGVTGMSSSLTQTVLEHFNEIDKNHDGKVSNQEIQSYGVESDLEKRKINDKNRLVNNMSMYYDIDDKYDGSLLDYRYLDSDS